MRILSAITTVFTILVFAFMLTITATVAILLFVGLGSLLAWLSPLTFFQAVCVAIGSSAAASLIAYVLLSIAWRHGDDEEAARSSEDDFDEDYDDDDDDDFDEFDKEADRDLRDLRAIDVTEARPETRPQTPKVGRNEPCPCGSGKKYKHCCGA